MKTYRAKTRSKKGRSVDYTGQKFGYLTAIRFTGRKSVHQSRIWVLRCVCGNEIERPGTAFAGPIGTRSCGCMAKQSQGNATRTHSMSDHPAYHKWRGILDRCSNPNNTRWKTQGGRGITVSKRWQKFENFWADMGPTWKPGLSLHRKNSDGNYTKRNCRWSKMINQYA